MNKPVLGVVGGVGPLATAYFMKTVIQKTPASSDQDNIPMIVFNDPQIPDRTAFILDNSNPDPTEELTKVARWLEAAQADYLAIPCNTAHYFYQAIVDAVDIPVLNIMQETAREILRRLGHAGSVGLLATEGTASSGVFQGYLADCGLDTVLPTPEEQARVTSLIYDGVKAGNPTDPQELVQLGQLLRDRGCDMVISGCTELSVLYQELADDDRPDWLVDSMDVLAERCVSVYLHEHALNSDMVM